MFTHNYQHIISIENLLGAWKEFQNDKRRQKDVQEFQLHLMDNILSLHQDLKSKIYKHGRYEAFNISDPRQRNIHMSSVRDRLLHHAFYCQLIHILIKHSSLIHILVEETKEHTER